MRTVLVTGSKGFIGKNLVVALKELKYNVLEYDSDSIEDLGQLVSQSFFIFHLAGVNRPENTNEFYVGNTDSTKKLIETIEEQGLKIPVLISSSIQAEKDNDYGKSKKLAEDLILKYSQNNDVPVYIYRLPNAFGKWSKPNYNSVVSTFCYNISHGKEIQINDSDYELTLVYIDDIVRCFTQRMGSSCDEDIYKQYYEIDKTYQISIGKLAEAIYSFKKIKEDLHIPDMSNELIRKLHATYLSYMEPHTFKYALDMKKDARGYFAEILKSNEGGQFSVNYSCPGITKGNHYHHTKNEKFLVVKGKALIRFRHILGDKVMEYPVTDEKLEIVDIPPGYTHDIKNTGDSEMIFLIWANEVFDPENSDTYYLDVEI